MNADEMRWDAIVRESREVYVLGGINLFIHLPLSFLENHYSYILYPCWVSEPSINQYPVTQPSISTVNQIKQRLVLPLLFPLPLF